VEAAAGAGPVNGFVQEREREWENPAAAETKLATTQEAATATSNNKFAERTVRRSGILQADCSPTHSSRESSK
jgi:hypothetical protein